MELVAGESLEPVLDDPAVEPALAAARMLRAAEMLPALHDVPARQGAGRRRAARRPPTSWPAGPARWLPCPPDLVPGRGPAAASGSPPTVPDAVDADAGARRLPARQPHLRRHRAGRADRLGDLERRRPARRARLVPGLRRRHQLPRRRPRGARTAHRRRAGRGATPRTAGRSTTWPGSTPSAASRWPRSWATTCAGTARAATTTRTRRRLPDTIDRLIATGARHASAELRTPHTRREDCRGLRAHSARTARPAGTPAGVHGRARLSRPRRSTTRRSPRTTNPHEQPQVMRDLQAKARELGLWNLFMTHGAWGAGLTNLEYAPLDGAGRPVDHRPRGASTARPPTPATWRSWRCTARRSSRSSGCDPLLDCRIRSAFAMTEPDGGQLRRHATSPRPSAATATSTSSTAASGTPPGILDPDCKLVIFMGKSDPDGADLPPAEHDPGPRRRPGHRGPARPADVRLPGPARPRRGPVHRRAGAGRRTCSAPRATASRSPRAGSARAGCTTRCARSASPSGRCRLMCRARRRPRGVRRAAGRPGRGPRVDRPQPHGDRPGPAAHPQAPPG